jgi:uncharacterized membrane protein
MIRKTSQRLALILFCIYLAVLPGSTIVVALDRVPRWGAWMGGALLLIQGAAALCWLLGRHGARGGLAALLVFLLAWAVEHAGVTTGMPFGRYHYTGALQPQLLGAVPLAIPCAWLMVAAGAWQLSSERCGAVALGRWGEEQGSIHLLAHSPTRPLAHSRSVVLAAMLVLLLDLQIETVATKINRYWIWRDGGPYYGVPTANFMAWSLIGLTLALVMAIVLGRQGEEKKGRSAEAERHLTSGVLGITFHVSDRLPAYLYLLSTLMFAIVNLAHGYTVAGVVGVFVLFVVFSRQRSRLTRRRGDAEIRKQADKEIRKLNA